MISSQAFTPQPAAVLTSIATLAAMPPPTLLIAFDNARTIKDLANSLQSTEFAEVGVKIVQAADAAFGGENRPRTLPQAREKLLALGELIPAVPVTPPEVGRMRGRAAKSTATPVAALASDASADSATYDRYEALKGAERRAFFSANREVLVREHGRRASAAKQTVHAGLIEQYTSLTGQARRDFYAQHQRELFAAYRARNAAR